jgi:hypothetical protein
MIKTIDDLKKLSKKAVGIVVSKLGLKSKLILAKESIGKDYKFLNFNPERVLLKVENNKKAKLAKPKLAVKESAEEKQVEKPAKPTVKPAKPKKELKGEE